jgi:hypothetical protein
MLQNQKSTTQLETRGKPQYLPIKSMALATNIHNSVSVIKKSRIWCNITIMPNVKWVAHATAKRYQYIAWRH